MLPLTYLDKLLDEIQLRFRDKYAQVLKEFDLFGKSTFSDFGGEFETTLALVEKKSKAEASKKMMTFEEVWYLDVVFFTGEKVSILLCHFLVR